MKKLLENADRVDRDAFEREQERLRREREAIDEAIVRLPKRSSTRSPRRSSRTSTGEIIFPSLATAL